jgi:hypothetical protein
LDTADDDAFATVDIEVEEMLDEEEDGAEACTKCFKLVEDVEEITELLLLLIVFEVVLGVSVVLFV